MPNSRFPADMIRHPMDRVRGDRHLRPVPEDTDLVSVDAEHLASTPRIEVRVARGEAVALARTANRRGALFVRGSGAEHLRPAAKALADRLRPTPTPLSVQLVDFALQDWRAGVDRPAMRPDVHLMIDILGNAAQAANIDVDERVVVVRMTFRPDGVRLRADWLISPTTGHSADPPRDGRDVLDPEWLRVAGALGAVWLDGLASATIAAAFPSVSGHQAMAAARRSSLAAAAGAAWLDAQAR